MKVGDRVTIGGQKFQVMFVYEDYVLATLADADETTMAESTLVFKLSEDKQLKLVKDKEEIKIVIRKLVETIQGK